jgi:hypothetical protein
MSRYYRLSLSTLALVVVAPLAWVACGGGKPPQTPADENDSGAAAASSGDDTSATASSAAPADSSSTPAPAATADTPPPAPPPPTLGSTDCGKCIDKTCAKQAAACGKNTDCQSTLDGIHACTPDKGAAGNAACISGPMASAPAAGKPKKLAAAYGTCAAKAVAKACKSACK